MIVMPIAGFFSGSTVGWPGVFYLLGGIGFVWTAIWMFCGLDSPHHHKLISPEELNYIQDGVVKKTHNEEVCMQIDFKIQKKFLLYFLNTKNYK